MYLYIKMWCNKYNKVNIAIFTGSLRKKLNFHLRTRDIHSSLAEAHEPLFEAHSGYRVLLNLQYTQYRGLPVEPIDDLIKNFRPTDQAIKPWLRLQRWLVKATQLRLCDAISKLPKHASRSMGRYPQENREEPEKKEKLTHAWTTGTCLQHPAAEKQTLRCGSWTCSVRFFRRFRGTRHLKNIS